MSVEFDFLTANDKPALVGLSRPDLLDTAQVALSQLGYKVHCAANHGDFLHKYAQVQYEVVVMEELFCATKLEENESLLSLQRMPMTLRRHSTIMLFGESLATFNPLQAFQYGVHAVLNPNEMFLLIQLLQKVVADGEFFNHTYRETQQRYA